MNEKSNMPVRQEFGATQMMTAGPETAATAIAAQAKAMVEARYIMAMQRPRNWDQVRQDVLRECRRPAFANNKSAFYKKPIGKGVEGLGIRFVEVAMRCMTNMLIETSMVFEDQEKEIHRVSVTDLESNCTYPLDVRVTKTVERSRPHDDGTYVSVRKNSYGKPVYTVWGTDDDLLNKRYAMISKAIRTLGLRLIPGDIQDEAESIIKQVRNDSAAEDPDAERKKLADAFSGIGVKAADLQGYLGHGLDACSPAELADLRGLYGAIRDGESTWGEAVQNKVDMDDHKAADTKARKTKSKAAAAEKKTGKRTASVAEKVAQAAKDAQSGADDDALMMTADELAARVQTTQDAAALDEIEDLARSLADPAEHNAVLAIIEKRRGVLGG